MPDKRCLSLRQRMTVFGFFGRALLSIRAGAWIRAPTRRCVGGRVDTRPYEAGGRRRARRYAPLQGGRSSAGAWIRAPTRLEVVGGRVGTRPYKAGGRRRARGYAPLRGAAFRNVGAAYFNPPAGRPQILNSPFSILNSAAGRRPESGRPTQGEGLVGRRPEVWPPYAGGGLGGTAARGLAALRRREG